MPTTLCIAVLANINMILGGINEQSHEQGNHQAALSKAQLLKCNSILYKVRVMDLLGIVESGNTLTFIL